MAEEGILALDVINGAPLAVVVRDYPEYPKGACVLVLQRDRNGVPIHVVWGMPKGHNSPAVLITTYRPDTTRWNDDFLGRKP